MGEMCSRPRSQISLAKFQGTCCGKLACKPTLDPGPVTHMSGHRLSAAPRRGLRVRHPRRTTKPKHPRCKCEPYDATFVRRWERCALARRHLNAPKNPTSNPRRKSVPRTQRSAAQSSHQPLSLTSFRDCAYIRQKRTTRNAKSAAKQRQEATPCK